MSRNSMSVTKDQGVRLRSRKQEDDALSLLVADHKKVKKMFEQFAKLKHQKEVEAQKQLLVETACAELSIHAQLEEELFYPAAHNAIGADRLLDEARVEHDIARRLIADLAAMHPGDDLYDAKFAVLAEYVRHHIAEEEKILFPRIKNAGIDLTALGEELQDRRLILREALGFTGLDETPGTEAGSGSRKMH